MYLTIPNSESTIEVVTVSEAVTLLSKASHIISKGKAQKLRRLLLPCFTYLDEGLNTQSYPSGVEYGKPSRLAKIFIPYGEVVRYAHEVKGLKPYPLTEGEEALQTYLQR